ncbi:response regulator [Anaerobacillus sp. CMMVII]|uniref:ATP-binding protein n=1 Tax=Anaerobacillus sp. CMMVII TaxID=2755588 RepID=UPI0021B7DFA7|nr:ATP-binding protein [Anaerobacillus sp. CMMVII]MCT8140351.1 response regulator [Anaerobacillus sp. CMMVII]
MKLKTKLYVGFGTILVILVLICSIVLYTLNLQKVNMEFIVYNNFERVNLANELKYNAETKARVIREYFIHEKGEVPLLGEEEIRQLTYESIMLFEQKKMLVSDEEEQKKFLLELENLNNELNANIQMALEYVKTGSYEKAKHLILVENAEVRTNLIAGINQLTVAEENLMDMLLAESLQTYQGTIILFLILISSSFLLVIMITASVIRSFSISLNTVRDIMVKIPKHSFESIPRIAKKVNNEFDEVAEAYNEMADALEHFAISEKELKNSLQEENWVKTKYAELTNSFQGAQKLNTFSNIFISKVALTVEATYGVFYFKHDNRFKRAASYAVSKENLGELIIHKGEGLVGQCAVNNKVILLDNLPAGYIETKSGLGGATPTSIIILPIQFEGEVLGILELAKFDQFTSLERRLLEQVCNSIGPNLDRIQYHMEIERLLTESQSLTEELQAQSEELQQQQEELKTINEDLYKENIRSEEKTKELEIIKSNLEQKNREVLLSSKYKTEFLANMSHELRTPLNSMLILSEILSENNECNLSEKQIEYAKTIHTSGKDLLNLINDILDLSKVESGKLDIFPEEVEISEIKAFVHRQFEPLARKKGLDFEIVIDHQTPEILFTDDQRIKQILKNLLSNAIKFTNTGKVLLKIEPGNSNSKISFIVTDTGIGIPKDKHQSIFEAFSQVDGTTSRNYGGTGLGLSISRELSQLLGGYIEVSSEEGVGSSFSLHLPDLIEEKPTLENLLVAATLEEEVLPEDNIDFDTSEAEEFENIKVLIVDDDMRNVFALTSALEMEKMNVLYAENGFEAMDILAASKVDIILMDIMMPKMNGYEAMVEIRNNENLKDIPIIALTAKAMKADRQKCISAGASDYISKPVKMEQLLSLMKVWLYK